MTLDEEEMFSTFNEFRSDTFTVPTRAMIEDGFLNATYGDSVYLEDEATLKLESKMCELTGKPAALFCVSGTMSNQIGIRTNLMQPPYSVLCDYRSHIYLHEAAGLATLSQAMVHPVRPANGNYLTLEDILDNVTYDDGDIHAAPTKLISLENTLHGIIMPIEEIERISRFCRDHDIKLHLDGARLINASVETGIPLKEYCQWFDSVSICLSKSLAAPIGSILVGDTKFIARATHFKKQQGGGIRQAGLMTTMAIHALDYNVQKIKKSHDMAKDVGRFCADHGIVLESPVDTNFVFIDLKANQMDPKMFVELGRTKYNVKLMGGRIAFHFQLSRQSVENLKACVLECFEYAQEHPHKSDGKNNKKMYDFEAMKK
ncbi:Low-specificity L-threonine aldolase [Candida viswanathii]|uniref:low-specificity L-threonine aldolase n=1 Tax=Candida viswanathii TaxID=5486 RepID=A0A367YE10_9ASCO|nr:Low-specificity L-threonine aldolase [Candida viswanathii]